MLTPALRKEVFESDTTILTRVKNSPPTLYGFESKAKNSLIADGCTIDGNVENCVIFRGVTIEKGAVLKDCVIMQNSVIHSGAKLECVITDKDVTVEADHKSVTYTLRDGPGGSLEIRHAGEELELTTKKPTTVKVKPRKALLAPPPQPPGREPLRRQRRSELES